MQNAQGDKNCHSTTMKDSPFIGIALPMGVRSKPKESAKIAVSLCVNINKCFTGLSSETGESKQDFYTRLQSLGTLLAGNPSLKVFAGSSLTCMDKLIDVKGSVHPLQYATGDLVRNYDHLALREKLWRKVFPSGRTINPKSRVPSPPVGKEIVSLTENLPHTNEFITGIKASDVDSQKRSLTKTLQQMRDFAGATAKRAKIDKLEFYEKYKPANLKDLIEKLNAGQLVVNNVDTAKQLADEFADIHQQALSEYLKATTSEIEIDEVIHSFSALSNEPAIMRLMGLILDMEIDLPSQFIPKPGAPIYFYLTIEMDDTKDIGIVPTKIKAICNNDRTKYAYLVAEDEEANQTQFFENSILKSEIASNGGNWKSDFCLYDKVAQEFRLQGIHDARSNDSGATGDDGCDAFTRGIIYCNTGLHEMVKPVSVQCEANGEVKKDFSFTESYVSHGHRVGAVIRGEYYSLTGRRLELSQYQSGCREPFYISDLNEGPIHFDAVSNYIEGGNLKSAATDALFEYSGELLSLKSVFSRFKRTTKADVLERASYSHDDGGLDKTKERISKAINYTYFPADPEKPKPESTEPNFFLSCHYDLPHHYTPTHSPKLRFYTRNEPRTYTFVVYQEYLNGWGLPLEELTAFPWQLSVKDLTEADHKKFLPDSIPFDPLECKRPVLVFHTKNPAHSEVVRSEPLETLVVWSEDVDSIAHSSSRFVLPARIAMEHALWYGLLERMSGEQSCDWKNKYNCPFASQVEFNAFREGEGNPECPENGCSSYCGGTAMRPFYDLVYPEGQIIPNYPVSPVGQIIPNHLSDPSIVGFSVSCFRDNACEKNIFEKEISLNFKGTPGIEPLSCRIIAKGATKDNEIYKSDFLSEMTLRVKPGMTMWVRLKNRIADDYERHLTSNWYERPAVTHAGHSVVSTEKERKNPPRLIKIVHAVKKPVVSPEIIAFSSKPKELNEGYKYSHVQEWLDREYPGLTLDSNVIVDRLKTHKDDTNQLGSSMTAVTLKARFERLDAFLEDGKVAFLDGELPTGGLELWMRKEEYIDNPEQIVVRSNSQQSALINHLPDQPVIPFDDRERNVSSRDFQIDFNNVLHQLKVPPVSVGDPRGDIVRELTSTLDLQFDARGTKFEERRYTLRNLSLFKGYFTDKEDERSEDYIAKSPEIRVLLLNNRKPEKPEVSHAVTTIQEERRLEDNITTTRQKGNIVTIYLKRGRLSSGKNERVGVVVYNETSKYHRAWLESDLISKAGRDIVSDPNIPTASPFIRFDQNDCTKQDIVLPEPKNVLSHTNEFDGRFHEDLGIISYLPKFDPSQNLWKFEVELNIKTADGRQLHNPFVVFTLVHFQPYSVNYNKKYSSGRSLIHEMNQDLRISAAEPFVWCYLLPERRLSVSFRKPGLWGLGSWTDFFEPYGRVDLTVSFDKESLYFTETDVLRSNFILSVEGSNDKVAWYPVMSTVDGETEKWKLMHPLLTKGPLPSGSNKATKKLLFQRESNPDKRCEKKIPSQKFSDFRVRLVEVERFNDKEWTFDDCDYTDVTEDQGLRVRYVELIY